MGEQQKSVKHSIPIRHAADITDLEKILSEMVWPVSGGAAFHPVLILLADAQGQARIESRLGKNQQQQLYYLNGGIAALEAFQADQVALASHTDQTFAARPVTSHPVSRPVVSGRCGSCGK